MLTLSGITKAYGGRTLFSDVTLQINREDRIGALRFGQYLNLHRERLNMPVELLPCQDERLGAHLSGRGQAPG